MKNIMLLGISRSGKSTFANILHDKYNYNIIHGDMIKSSYQKHINNRSSAELKDDDNYRLFIKDIFYHEVKYNNTNCIIDTVDIFPTDITEEDKEKYIIYFFGFPDIEPEELVKIWKTTDLEFTKRFTDEELLAKATRGVNKSKWLKKSCESNHVTFVNTTYNRNETFKKLLDEVEKN